MLLGVATFVVNKGDKLPAEKLVTVPVFDVQSGVKYSNAVALELTLNNWFAVPKVPNPVPPLDIANTPVHPIVKETPCNNDVAGVPPKLIVTFVSSVLVRAEGVIEGIEGKVFKTNKR